MFRDSFKCRIHTLDKTADSAEPGILEAGSLDAFMMHWEIGAMRNHDRNFMNPWYHEFMNHIIYFQGIHIFLNFLNPLPLFKRIHSTLFTEPL